ncbi:hypothetical protein ACN28E_37910 [Archangium lansingense]|uniref:hypothetical protein n=1 Tax=Archangium lansingense TaxID=2995310 RepID=UPI003B7F3367
MNPRIQTAASRIRWAVPLLVVLLLTVSGCFSSTPYECTAADTTHSCCLKKNFRTPEVCDGLEGAETTAFRTASATNQGTVSSGTAVAAAAGAAVGGAIGVLIQGDEEELDELQDELDQLMEECADRAEQAINRRRLGGRVLTAAECNEVVGRDADGEPVTRAMELGREKHKESFKCIEEKLGGRIPKHFLIEQRYRVDRARGRVKPMSKEEVDRLVRLGQKGELKGTVEPDVVIHSGEPTRARFVYEFKFPCTEGAPTTWTTYSRGPYKGLTQMLVYWNAFGVKPSLVKPGKGVLR